ncbi:MAG: hypothetical protein GXP45_08415 [bacterium]|nr:hypothetical protein [bacterium]
MKKEKNNQDFNLEEMVENTNQSQNNAPPSDAEIVQKMQTPSSKSKISSENLDTIVATKKKKKPNKVKQEQTIDDILEEDEDEDGATNRK